jgi:hypothetical protein
MMKIRLVGIAALLLAIGYAAGALGSGRAADNASEPLRSAAPAAAERASDSAAAPPRWTRPRSGG